MPAGSVHARWHTRDPSLRCGIARACRGTLCQAMALGYHGPWLRSSACATKGLPADSIALGTRPMCLSHRLQHTGRYGAPSSHARRGNMLINRAVHAIAQLALKKIMKLNNPPIDQLCPRPENERRCAVLNWTLGCRRLQPTHGARCHLLRSRT